ncbi:hypothetical protein PINS_up003346 [Pythium insidiosum]|nr:hypothetical protein PINS_up003346 [Pythium insidiosum]
MARTQHCSSTLSREADAARVAEVDDVLYQDSWRWLRSLMETDGLRRAVVTTSKLFFLRLLRAERANEVTAVLTEMEQWREHCGDCGTSRQQRELVQALFLLGVDKQLHLERQEQVTPQDLRP